MNQMADWTPDFIAELARTGNVTRAAIAAGVSYRNVYHHRSVDPDFAALWDEAREMSKDVLAHEARRRAVDGVAEAVYYQGEVVGTVQRYSDTLLIFLMKGEMPDKYADRRQISGPDGGPLRITHTGEELRALPDDELAAQYAAKIRPVGSAGD